MRTFAEKHNWLHRCINYNLGSLNWRIVIVAMVRSMDSITIGMEWYPLVLTSNQNHYGYEDNKTICIDTYAIPMNIGPYWCVPTIPFLWVPYSLYWSNWWFSFCLMLQFLICMVGTSTILILYVQMEKWYKTHYQ